VTVTDDVRAAREAVVREHMESENRQDFEATMATFARPRYELIATGEVHDGDDAVRAYYASSRSTFNDQRNEVIALQHTDNGVWVEFDLLGTHTGALGPFAATGKEFRCRMAALFLFADDPTRGALINCERVYFDSGTILRQLGLR